MSADRGVALAGVLLIGFALSLLVSVIVARGVRAFGNTQNDAEWEQAVFVAESGLADGLARVEADPFFSTGHSLPESYLNTATESSWVLAHADEVASEFLFPTPEGEYVFIKPDNVGIVYGIGFVPSRAATDRTVRIVRAEIDSIPSESTYTITHAFMTGGDLTINGNPNTFGVTGGIHANGRVDMSGNPTLQDACLSSSNGIDLGGTLNHPADCESPGAQAPEEIPEIVPRDFWWTSQYDLCPSGAVKAGPSHPTLGNTVGNSPCTGQTLVADASSGYRGWVYNGCCDEKEWAKWDYGTNTAYHGVYYFHEGTVRVPSNPGTNTNPWRVTIIASSRGTCPANVAGDVFLSGQMVMHPYTDEALAFSDNTTLVVAGRDVEWGGNGRIKQPGIVAAHEQIKVNGNPIIEDQGTYLAEDACDSADLSNIHSTEITGEPVFHHNGELLTSWITQNGPPVILIDGWDEL
jgi:hypothetical protein